MAAHPLLGKDAPDFTLVADSGKPWNLYKHLRRRLMLVFYPGDNTLVCTKQLCDYAEGLQEFTDLDVEVVGISTDDTATHQAFKAARKLPFVLLSDPGLKVAENFGVKGMLGMKRAVFLIDSLGTVRYAHVELTAIFRRTREQLIQEIRKLKE